jgi:hypothetical protein
MQRSRAWRRSQNKRIQAKRLRNIIICWGNGGYGYRGWILESEYMTQPHRLAKHDPLRNHSNRKECGCCWDDEGLQSLDFRKAPTIKEFDY